MHQRTLKVWLYRGNQWLYRGQRPNWLARMLNGAWAAVASSGFAAGSGVVTLEVTGRRSGRTISLPVVTVILEWTALPSVHVGRQHSMGQEPAGSRWASGAAQWQS
jgi:hypothetical protein